MGGKESINGMVEPLSDIYHLSELKKEADDTLDTLCLLLNDQRGIRG